MVVGSVGQLLLVVLVLVLGVHAVGCHGAVVQIWGPARVSQGVPASKGPVGGGHPVRQRGLKRLGPDQESTGFAEPAEEFGKLMEERFSMQPLQVVGEELARGEGSPPGFLAYLQSHLSDGVEGERRFVGGRSEEAEHAFDAIDQP